MSTKQQNKKYVADFVGCDTETGGLNGYVTLDSGERVHGALYYPILELAFVVPTVDENKLLDAGSHSLVVGIAMNEERMSRLHPWALKSHTESGLLTRLETGEGFDFVADTTEEAEQFIIDKLIEIGVRPFNRKEGTGGMLVGNNIAFDQSFIDAQMPKLNEFFHYRKADVSTINVLARTIWNDVELPMMQKELKHTALSDIKESVKELNGYTAHLGALSLC